jgi:DNA-directed RNA polymerase specialized sigma24 family protein
VPGSAAEPDAAGYRPLLFSIAYGMTGSVGDAEDIVQDAFLGLTRARQAGTTIADPNHGACHRPADPIARAAP